MPNEPSTTRFLSLVSRPPALAPPELVKALLPIVEHDEDTLSYYCQGIPPFVVSPLPGPIAKASVAVLKQLQCRVFAPKLSDLHDLGPTMVVRAIHLDESGFIFETWQDHLQRLTPADFLVFVSKYAAPEDDDDNSTDAPGKKTAAADSTIRPALGAFRRSTPKLSARKHDPLLDLHTKDGRVFQIDGRHFAYEVLGSRRQDSDYLNMVALQSWFDGLVPNVTLDTNFASFHLPHGYERLRLPRAALTREQPDFSFYSRWIACVHQHVAPEKNKPQA